MATDKVNGFSVVLPAGWTQITDMAELKANMQTQVSDPELKAKLKDFGSVLDLAAVFALKRPVAGLSANLTILVSSAGGVDAEHIFDIYQMLKQGLEQRGGQIRSQRVYSIAGTQGLRLEVLKAEGSASARITQAYVVKKDKMVILSITQGDVSSSTAEADAIINSLRFS